MTRNEIALELTLALIQKGNYFASNTDSGNAGIGKDTAELFNAVFQNITCDDESPNTATFG